MDLKKKFFTLGKILNYKINSKNNLIDHNFINKRIVDLIKDILEIEREKEQKALNICDLKMKSSLPENDKKAIKVYHRYFLNIRRQAGDQLSYYATLTNLSQAFGYGGIDEILKSFKKIK